MAEAYDAFLQNQAQVYDRAFRAPTADLGTQHGLEPDAGADHLGAYLVAWRFPAATTALLQEFSEEVAATVPAVTYGPDNGHVTLSDFRLGHEPVRPDEQDDAEIIDTLTLAVGRVLGNLGSQAVRNCGINFGPNLTNGKAVIATGVPTETVWQINQQVKQAAGQDGVPLKGSWGSHMTVNRFLEARTADSPAVRKLAALLENSRPFGTAKPNAIDVGHFFVDPQNGFNFTPRERFDLQS